MAARELAAALLKIAASNVLQTHLFEYVGDGVPDLVASASTTWSTWRAPTVSECLRVMRRADRYANDPAQYTLREYLEGGPEAPRGSMTGEVVCRHRYDEGVILNERDNFEGRGRR